MTPEHAFLDSIWDDLDDDATKLIFADWLDERDDWRSWLLRWQVERNRHGFWTAEFRELHGQIRRHLFQHGRDWRRPLDRYHLQYSDGTGLLWLRLSPADLLRLPEPRTADGVCRWVTEVTVDSPYLNDVLTALERGPRVRLFLNFSQNDQADLGRLVAARGLDRVRSLDLTFCRHRTGDLDRLLAASGLASLQYLFLGHAVGPGVANAVEALCQARHLTNLRGLDLAKCGLGVGHVEALAQAPGLEGLTALYLEENRFGDAGLAALAASPHLKRLQVLNVQKCGDVSQATREQIARRFPFASL